MIIPYGVFSSVSSSNRPKGLTCDSCGQNGQIVVEKHIVSVHVFYVPLFPIKISDEFNCLNCNESVSYQEMGPQLRKYYKPFKSNQFPRFWHFSGVLMLVLVGIWWGCNRYSNRRINVDRLERLSIGRIIEYQSDNSSYSSMKVCGISRDSSILLVHNSFEVASYSEINRILFSSYYSTDTLEMKPKVLIDMAWNGEIKSVHW